MKVLYKEDLFVVKIKLYCSFWEECKQSVTYCDIHAKHCRTHDKKRIWKISCQFKVSEFPAQLSVLSCNLFSTELGLLNCLNIVFGGFLGLELTDLRDFIRIRLNIKASSSLKRLIKGYMVLTSNERFLVCELSFFKTNSCYR